MIEPVPYAVGTVVEHGLAEDDDVFTHIFLGRHGGFTGRRYRRGEHRCLYCGAPLDAPDRAPQE